MFLTSIHIRGDINIPANATASNTSDVARFIVYWDKQCNGAAATMADILDTSVTNDVYAFRNLQNSSRFAILYDKTYSIACGGGISTSFGENVKGLKINVKCNIPIEYGASTGAITDLKSNNIGILAVARDGIADTAFVCRVRFTG
jgi:hypothetical protein